MMQLLTEINNNRLHTRSMVPQVHCKVFKDNSGALELAHTPKMRPHTKHISQVYQKKCDFARNVTIKILQSKVVIRSHIFS